MRAGAIIGSYIIERELGRGGMGVVYLARDTRLDRPVVLKTLPEKTARDPASLARFRNEALLLASVDHPRIGRIYSLEEVGEAVYLVLEFVPGEGLAERLRRGPLPPDEALRIASQLASAVEAAHHGGIIHRDLKPANVRITPDGSVKVLDFGLARSVAPLREENLRAVGGDSPTLSLDEPRDRFVGTPQYMSPEQARGGLGDERGDIWAFGCILYECLTARRAFDGHTLADVFAATLTAEPDWTILPPDTPPGIRKLLLRCLQKDPARRPAEMSEVRAEIEAVVSDSPAQIPTGEAGLAAIPNNLPRPLTSFIGRESDIARIGALLGTARLVTLTGPGGCGKTRLAIEAAAFVAASFPDGVRFVGLASLTDPKLVLPAVAGVLGVKEDPGGTLTEAIARSLRWRRVLIVLDNCEHLLQAASGLTRSLLGLCPELRILATSRQGLAIPGETLLSVPPLTMPGGDRTSSAASVRPFESVRLLVERAREVRHDFALTDRNAPVVAQICRRLDGIPLAIELAAARLRVLSVEQIDARLDERLRLLTDGTRSERERHRTLRAAIDWSYELLSEPEKRLFRSLAVFAGGFTLETASAVCGQGLDEFELLDLLTHLVDKSLVQVEEGPEGDRRYTLLETLRQYAAARLDETGEMEALRDLHLDFFLELADRAEKELLGPRQKRWLDRLEAERRNHFAALEWCSRSPDRAGKQLALCAALWLFWHRHAHFGVGREAIAEALARSDAALRTQDRAKALRGAGVLAWRQNDWEAAQRMHEEALSIQRELGDETGVGMSLNDLGNLAYALGDYGEARRMHDAALAVRRRLEDSRGIAASLTNLGNVAFDLGELARARALHEESLEIYRKLGNSWGVAACLSNLGLTARGQGDLEAAMKLGREALALQRELGDKWGITASLTNIASSALESGQEPAARPLLRESIGIWRDLGDRTGIAEALMVAGALAVHSNPALAARLLASAEHLHEELGTPIPPGERPLFARSVSATRSALGDEELKACWAEGRSVSWEAAVRLALEWLAGESAASC